MYALKNNECAGMYVVCEESNHYLRLDSLAAGLRLCFVHELKLGQEAEVAGPLSGPFGSHLGI